MENNKISLGQSDGKKQISRGFYRRNNTKKNGKCHTGSVLNCLRETDQTTATIKTYIKLSKLEANSLQKFYHTEGLSGINRHPGGGGVELPYERGGDARRLAQGVIFGFWSHLECSEQNAIIFSRKGLFQGCKRRNVKKLYSFNLFYLLDSCNQSLLGVKKRLGLVQIGLLKRSDQHSRPIHMEVSPGPSAVKGPKFNRQPSKKLFFTVNRQKYRLILTVKKFQGITNLTISADLYGDSCS